MRWNAAVLMLVALALLPRAASGGGTRSWDISDFRGLQGLDPGGAVITADGGLSAGIERRAWVGPVLPVVWKVEAGAAGQVLAVGGDPGTVLSFSASGEGHVLLELADAGVTAMARGTDGRLHVGLSPGGRILTLSDDGRFVTGVETGARYVWDMLAATDGGIWLAVGDPGSVLLWRPGSEPTVVVSLGPEQARCLAPGADDQEVLVGTAGEGRVLAINTAGGVRVLMDSDADEVTDLTMDHQGRVVAALADRPGPASAAPAKSNGQPVPAGEPVRAGRLLRLEKDGLMTELWADKARHPLSVLARESGEIWFGLGPEAEVRAVSEPGRDRQVAKLMAGSLTALAANGRGGVLVATGGLGTVGLLRPDRRMAGQATSPVHEAGPGARFGAARWWMRAGKDRQVELSFRSGPSARPGDDWSPWSRWHGGGEAPAPAAPAGRFVQWRARFEGGEGDAPELARVSLSYLPPNHPPEMSEAEVLPSGVVLELLPLMPGQGGAPDGSAAAAALAGQNGGAPPMARVRRMWRPGERAVTWSARDSDGDPLTADLLLRADGESDFLELARGLTESYHNLDEAMLPDGGYVIRVRVSDEPGNTPERAAAVVADTARFVVDRTPPRLGPIDWRREGETWVFSFTVEDSLAPPSGVRLAVDGGPLRAVLPRDGVEDGLREDYEVHIPATAKAPTVVVVEARDGAGNAATARRRFAAQE